MAENVGGEDRRGEGEGGEGGERGQRGRATLIESRHPNLAGGWEVMYGIERPHHREKSTTLGFHEYFSQAAEVVWHLFSIFVPELAKDM